MSSISIWIFYVGLWFNTNMLLKRDGWLLQVKEDVNMMGAYIEVIAFSFLVNSAYILIVLIVRIFTLTHNLFTHSIAFFSCTTTSNNGAV